MTFEILSRNGTRFRVETLAESPHLRARLDEIAAVGWPPFMRADEVSEARWARLLDTWPGYQFGIVRADDGVVVGAGHSVPCAWDGTVPGLPDGWDDVVETAISSAERTQPGFTTASALSVVSDPAERSTGLAAVAIAAMRRVVRHVGHETLIAPVRPNLKHRYPLIPMESYVAWTDEEHRCFDPWLRAHLMAGARILGVAPRSMTIVAEVREWERWLGAPMPGEGDYVIPDALVPVQVDSHGKGYYVEPNVWMSHVLNEDDFGLEDGDRRCPPN